VRGADASAPRRAYDIEVARLSRDRVAIVALHGVADQRPGQTVRELARLLTYGADGAPRYVEGETHGVLVPVGPLEPAAPARADAALADGRALPGATSGFYRTQKDGAPAADLGLALTDYLLQRHQLAESDALYESTRASLVRRADARAVDLYEMYWADLSRLRAGGVRALSALYQLFFHLNLLARDIVDQVALTVGGGTGWRALQRLHAWSAWLMTGPAALIQLAMLLLVPFGAASLVPATQHRYLLAAAGAAAAALIAGAAVLVGLRELSRARRWLKVAPLLVGATGCASLAVDALLSVEPTAWMYLGAAVLLVGVIGAFAVARLARAARGVGALGYGLIGAMSVALLVEAKRTLPQASTLPEWMLTAALHVGEVLLAALLIAWALLALVQIGALVLGLSLGGAQDANVRESLYTARLGMILSAGLFAVLSLVLWSVITYVAGLSIENFSYEPVVFGSGYRGAAIFLEARVQDVGGFFTPMVVAGALIAFAALLVLAPSLREELVPTVNVDRHGVRREAALWAPRLGHWLSAGFARLRGGLGVLVPLLAITGAAIYLAFVLWQFFPAAISGAWLGYLQGEALVAVGKWVAGGALTVTALGARFRDTFGRLRVALDAVLDIDNYFADPPDRQPPRARIFARFAGLLAHLRERGYARIVIVAHSQGTVISADLLRWLHAHRRLRPLAGEASIALVTVGSPLRDLYAARFPLLYRWMGSIAPRLATAGPTAADIGAIEWVNAYRSGDYVGRAIWTPPGDRELFRVATVGTDGVVLAKREGDRVEFCLGAGAHTHYFSNDAVALAVEIDRLIGGLPVREPGRS
jgi:hypothetical protein